MKQKSEEDYKKPYRRQDSQAWDGTLPDVATEIGPNTPKSAEGHPKYHPKDEELELWDVTTEHWNIITEFQKGPQIRPSAYFGKDTQIISEPGQDDTTIIHQLVTRIEGLFSKKDKGRQDVLDQTFGLKRLLQWVIIHHSELLPTVAKSNKTALQQATKKYIEILYWILDLLLDQETNEALQRACEKKTNSGTCCMRTDHLLVTLLKEDNASKSSRSWCPHDETEKINDLNRSLEMNLEKALRTTKGKSESCLHEAITHYCSNPSFSPLKRLIDLSGKGVIKVKARDDHNRTPLHVAVMEFREPKPEDKRALEDLKKIIRLLVEICPEALYEEDSENKTAYQQLASLEKTRAQGQEPSVQDQEAWKEQQRKEVLNILKESYIGNRPPEEHMDKMGYLYPEGVEERRISLNLCSEKTIDREFINALQGDTLASLRYETVLDYVSLPPRNIPTGPGQKEEGSDLLHSYKDVFMWLKRSGVKKIFRVVVNDLIDHPDGDHAIVESLKGLNVEKWQWAKLDISSKTIREAAPGVKVLSLHSSGNYAVLQGWACKQGLARLENGREAKPILESYRSLFDAKLKARLSKSHPHHVEVHVELAGSQVGNVGDSISKTASEQPVNQAEQNHEWIKHMKNFAQEITNLELPDLCDVKVAVIDDGINSRKLPFKVSDGKSFCESSEDCDDYFVNPGPHGTTMANLIHDICPGVKLYIARIIPSDYSKVPPAAATKAIEWALKMDVDIISMSWTLKSNERDPYTKAFREAVVDAVSKKEKIVFCSLHDNEGAERIENYYPVGIPEVFKIGSATRTGNQAESNSTDWDIAEFILPGHEVLDGGTNTKINGSSIATALASGLAALIICCVDIVDKEGNSRPGENVRSKGYMKNAFKNLSDKSKTKKFPEVKKHFPKLEDHEEDQGKLRAIETLSSLEPDAKGLRDLPAGITYSSAPLSAYTP
ncbi:hypothetical protein FGG08_005566 [Glutinoglossum americanum]|uniref:Peptidase S8/S53 domain-containing protein n=1 Tax=Glutinoglossum americanum TaxID=1670608 RepID=A0A9P8I2Q7_9PEZI|nr:hypothetical protein FGG08_005566 [Glutinoglossum americanum]